jgi:hypothetical protein
MSTPVVTCPFCGSSSHFALVAGDRNRELTSERFTYNRCGTCGTVFLVDVPDDLGRYYAGAYHGFGPDGEPDWRSNPTLRGVETARAEMLRSLVEPGLLIDIGAGAGAFASAATDAGFDVTAIEMDAACCDYLQSRVGVRAICSDTPLDALRELPPARVITMWHSLEHLRNPREMLTVAAGRLQVGGVLALGVPNPRALQLKWLGARWAHLDAPRHLCLVPEHAVVSSAKALGLESAPVLTDDPFERICALHGWIYALRRRPAHKASSSLTVRVAQALARVARPIERRNHRETTLTLVFVKRGALTSR